MMVLAGFNSPLIDDDVGVVSTIRLA